jgi:electron transfer flavoprotein alpha subunit
VNILAFAEQREGKFKKCAFEVVQAATKLAGPLGGSVTAVVVGKGVSSIAGELGSYGVGRVVAIEHDGLALYSTTAYAKAFADLARKENASAILLPASQMGKDLAPRLAGKLDAGVAADCVALRAEGGEIIATRPVYAGKGLTDVRVTTALKLFTLRPNVFTAAPSNGSAAKVEVVAPALTDGDFAARAVSVKIAEGRPDVTEAGIIVSGGRGLKAPENFKLVEALADVLGAAVGASRAVVDAGWRPHDEQVGQTGKTVSPSLYIACGISGAVQHLAGMSSSKYIVAINKDKDAPIFQIADYGIVGDVFEILPALTAELKKTLGR